MRKQLSLVLAAMFVVAPLAGCERDPADYDQRTGEELTYPERRDNPHVPTDPESDVDMTHSGPGGMGEPQPAEPEEGGSFP